MSNQTLYIRKDESQIYEAFLNDGTPESVAAVKAAVKGHLGEDMALSMLADPESASNVVVLRGMHDCGLRFVARQAFLQDYASVNPNALRPDTEPPVAAPSPEDTPQQTIARLVKLLDTSRASGGRLNARIDRDKAHYEQRLASVTNDWQARLNREIAQNTKTEAKLQEAQAALRREEQLHQSMRNSLRIQEERTELAANRCGLSYQEHGGQWASAAAGEILALRSQIERLEAGRRIDANRITQLANRIKLLESDLDNCHRSKNTAIEEARLKQAASDVVRETLEQELQQAKLQAHEVYPDLKLAQRAMDACAAFYEWQRTNTGFIPVPPGDMYQVGRDITAQRNQLKRLADGKSV